MKYILFLLATCIVVLGYLGFLYKHNQTKREEFNNEEIHLDGSIRIAHGDSKKVRVSKLCIDDECIEGNVLSNALSYFTNRGQGERDTNWRKNGACIKDVCLFPENINAFNKNSIPQLSTSNDDPKQLFNANSSQVDEMIKNRKEFFIKKFPEPLSNIDKSIEPYKSTFGFAFLFGYTTKVPKFTFTNKDDYLNKYFKFPKFYKSGTFEKTGQNVSSSSSITNNFDNKGFKMSLYNEDYKNVDNVNNVYDALGYEENSINPDDAPVNVKGNICYAPYSRINLRSSSPSSNQNLIFSRDVMEKDKDIIKKYNEEHPNFNNREDHKKMYLSGVPNFHSCFDEYENTNGTNTNYKETKHNYYYHDDTGNIENNGDIAHLQAHGKQWNERSFRGYLLAGIAYDGKNFDGNEYPIFVKETFGTNKTITMFSNKEDWKPRGPSWTVTYEPNPTDLLEQINEYLKEQDLDNLPDKPIGKKVKDKWIWRIEPNNEKKPDVTWWSNNKKNDPDFLTGFLYYRTKKIEMAAKFPQLLYGEANKSMKSYYYRRRPGGFLSIKIFKGFKIRFYYNVKLSRIGRLFHNTASFILGEGNYNNSYFNNTSFYTDYNFLREVISDEKRKQIKKMTDSVDFKTYVIENVKLRDMPKEYGIIAPTIAVIKTNQRTSGSTYVPSEIKTMNRKERPQYEKNARNFRFGPPVPLTASTINTQEQTTQGIITQSEEELRNINQAEKLQRFLETEL